MIRIKSETWRKSRAGRDALLYSLVVFRQPDGGEMAPSELPNDEIPPIREGVADVDRMVASLAVVFEIFLVFCHHGSHV